jgi:hypothetical protein
VFRETYLAKFPPGSRKPTSSSSLNDFKRFITAVCMEKQFYSEDGPSGGGESR